MPLPLLIAAAIPAVAGLVGQALASGDRSKAERLREEAMAQYNIDLPPVDELAQQADSSIGQYQQDPRIASARMQALEQLGRRAEEGYTIEDQAAVGAALEEAGQADRSARQAIEQRLSPNSGASIAAQLAAQQNAYQGAHRRALQAGADSRRQALNAIVQRGQMSDQFGRADFNEAATKANAQDSINRFNTQNRIDAPYRQFGAKMQLAAGKANAMGGQASHYDNTANSTANTALEIGRSARDAVVGWNEQEEERKRRNLYQRQPSDNTI